MARQSGRDDIVHMVPRAPLGTEQRLALATLPADDAHRMADLHDELNGALQRYTTAAVIEIAQLRAIWHDAPTSLSLPGRPASADRRSFSV